MKRIKMYREFIEGGDDVIDAKMSELSDLISNISGDDKIIYNWERGKDKELVINFIYNEISIRWEFDIDELIINKIVDNKVDFQSSVNSIVDGLEIVEKDVYMIAGVS